MALEGVVEHPAHPAQHVVGHRRRAALDDGLQHGVDVTRLNVFERQLADVGLDVTLDAAAHDVRVPPFAEDHALEVLVGQLCHRHDGPC